MKTYGLSILIILLLSACPSAAPPFDAMPTPDSAPVTADAAPDANAADAGPGPADAGMMPCIQEHRFSLGSPLDPPGAVAGPVGRVVYNQYGGVGVDDGFVDTGETFTVTWTAPTFLVGYGVTWMEDGPDPGDIPGEHTWEAATASGELIVGQGAFYETGNAALVPDTRELRLIPSDGDRMAVARVRWCNPIPECRCEDIAPIAP
jgi:hypothetical protein